MDNSKSEITEKKPAQTREKEHCGSSNDCSQNGHECCAQAAELFRGGFNCAQSVFCTFCDKYGFERETAAKMACGMGSGFRFGQICGAASGAVLVIGLKYGQSSLEDKASKQLCYEKTEEFLNLFRERNTSFLCRDILGFDLSTDDGLKKAKPQFATTCVDMVQSSVKLLCELGY